MTDTGKPDVIKNAGPYISAPESYLPFLRSPHHPWSSCWNSNYHLHTESNRANATGRKGFLSTELPSFKQPCHNFNTIFLRIPYLPQLKHMAIPSCKGRKEIEICFWFPCSSVSGFVTKVRDENVYQRRQLLIFVTSYTFKLCTLKI